MNSLAFNRYGLIDIISLLTIFSSLYLIKNQFFCLIGGICAISVLSFCILMLITNIHRFSFEPTLCIFLITPIYLIIQSTIVGNFAVYPLVSIMSFLGFMLLLTKVHIGIEQLNRWRYFFKNIYYWIIVIYTVGLLTDNIVFLNEIISPTFLKILFPLSWFSIKRNAGIITIIEISIFILFHWMFVERTALLCFVMLLPFQFILQKVNHKTSNILFILYLSGLLSFPFIYVYLYKLPIGQTINILTKEYTGENFFSGRHRVWKVIIDGVNDNIFQGLGFENSLLIDAGINFSTHNLYLYLLLNGGIFLLTLFIIYIYSIWHNIKHDFDSDIEVIVGKSYILILLLFLNFELFLLINNVVISLFWWITIAFILAASKSKKVNRDTANIAMDN